MTKTILLVAVATVCGDLLAQSNSRGPGYDGALTNVSSSRVWGRRGPAFPGGEVGVSFQNDLCNPGSIDLEWRAPMLPDHPKFSFLVSKLDSGRIVQISDWSYNKHAFLSLNNTGTCGGTCIQPPAGGQQMGVHCTDAYANSNNGDRFYLAPPSELNPWLGTWNPVGSYFDHGDPNVGGAAASDGVRSLSSAQVSAFDVVKNRVTIKEVDLQNIVSGNMFFQIQVVHEGEPASNRANNIMSRPFSLSWSGTAWSTVTLGSATQGTVLTRWAGATLNTAGNGNDDGRFTIANKVTGPVNGMWHYEYAVINVDNNRAGAGFHIPVCGGAVVQNIGFRDIDQNPLNDWTSSYTGSEVRWLAAPGNPHNWNTLYNFWFDSDIGPASGNATIDEANPGPGALSFTVPTTVAGAQLVINLGPGCGTPSASLTANSWPTAGNATFGLDVNTAPATVVLFFFSTAGGTTTLAPGCDVYLDLLGLTSAGASLTDGAGLTTLPIPIPPGLPPADLWFQSAPLIPSPPVLGLVGLTNGLKIRFASTGCN
jgi:hypothetical protein